MWTFKGNYQKNEAMCAYSSKISKMRAIKASKNVVNCGQL